MRHACLDEVLIKKWIESLSAEKMLNWIAMIRNLHTWAIHHFICCRFYIIEAENIGVVPIYDVCFRRYQRKVRIRYRCVFIFHTSCRVSDTDVQPHSKAGLKAHVYFCNSVSCPPGINSHEPRSRFLPVMCLTGVVCWPGCEGSILKLRKWEHLLMLTWTADAELSGNITICFFASEKEKCSSALVGGLG